MPGRLLGEQGFNYNTYFTTARLTTPSILYFFSEEDFNQLCVEAPEAIHLFTDSLLLKVRFLAEATAILNAPAEYRLAHFLYKQYESKNQRHILLSQTSLARFIGTSRVTVHKIINQWKRAGVLDYRNGTIHLMDIDKLKNYLTLSLLNQS